MLTSSKGRLKKRCGDFLAGILPNQHDDSNLTCKSDSVTFFTYNLKYNSCHCRAQVSADFSTIYQSIRKPKN